MYRFILLLFVLMAPKLYGQDSILIAKKHLSNYEKTRLQRNVITIEKAKEIWSHQGLVISSVSLNDAQGVNLAKGIRFLYMNNSEPFYLDMDEIASVIQILEAYISMLDERIDITEKTMNYISRGDIWFSNKIVSPLIVRFEIKLATTIMPSATIKKIKNLTEGLKAAH